MTTLTTIVRDQTGGGIATTASGGEVSAVSWPAIFAGATAAAALSLILLVLGIGLGFAVASPWAGGEYSEAMAWSAILWTLFTAFAASAFGGYLAGRLRVRWPGAQHDEVYFRDTAHGFLAWAVATLVTAVALSSVIGHMLAPAGAAPVAPAMQELTDEARRNRALASLWIFVSLLLGAFSASWFATFGGRQRDLP